jgi:hypothetical protein
VNFETEKLFLYPADIYPSNFKILKDEMGMVVFDFRATCFLSASFIAYTKRRPAHEFAQYANHPESSKLEAMAATSGYLILYGRNDTGQPDGFCFI